MASRSRGTASMAFGTPKSRDVVGRGLGAEQQVISDVLFDGAVAAVAADHRIREVEIFNQRFELAAVPLGYLAAEDGGEFRGLPNRAIRIEQALAERVQRGPPVEDQVVRVLDLREEEPMLTAGRPPLRWREERREGPEPLLGTAVDVVGGQAVGERLQAGGIAARQEGIGRLPKPHPVRPHAGGEPVMLVEAHAGREREVGAEAHEHPAPRGVVQIEGVLDDPASRVLEMPAICFPNGGEDPRGLAPLHDDHDLIGLRSTEVRLDEGVAATGGGLNDRYPPFDCPGCHPALVLGGDVGQDRLADRIL
jgi:hypothetical protein